MATVYFSPEHNSAAIAYDRSTMRDLPTDAINYALERLYNAPGDLGPFLYEAWEGDDFYGLVLSEPFGATDDKRIKLEFDHIVQRNKDVPETGDFSPKEIQV